MIDLDHEVLARLATNAREEIRAPHSPRTLEEALTLIQLLDHYADTRTALAAHERAMVQAAATVAGGIALVYNENVEGDAEIAARSVRIVRDIVANILAPENLT